MKYSVFIKKFKNERTLADYFIKVKYNNEVICNHCGSVKTYKYSDDKLKKILRCGQCNRDFSIFKDTILERTTTDLRKWMYALHLFITNKEKISAYELQTEINVTYKTAWRMFKQIRNSAKSKDKEFFNIMLEIHKVYVLGKKTVTSEA